MSIPPLSMAARTADDPEVEVGAGERIIFFSDAVVAIAITLLALDLPVPVGTNATTNGQLLHELRQNLAAYLAFGVSFLVIARHWTGHRRVFRYLNRINERISRLNMVWLLMMALIPFAARMLADHGGLGVRVAVYALIQVIASACLLAMNHEAIRKNLLRPDAPRHVRHPDDLPSLVIIAGFLASIPVAFFTEWAFALWGLGSLFTLPERIRHLRG